MADTKAPTSDIAEKMRATQSIDRKNIAVRLPGGGQSSTYNGGSSTNFVAGTLTRPNLVWHLNRMDVVTKIVSRHYEAYLANLPINIDIGYALSCFARAALPLVRGNPDIRHELILFDVNFHFVGAVGAVNRLVIDCNGRSINSWPGLLCHLLALLPSECLWSMDSIGNLRPFSPNPRRCDVYIVNYDPVAIPPMAGVLDCSQPAIETVLNTVLMNCLRGLESIISHSDKKEFAEDFPTVLGCLIGSGYQCRFANPDGTAGFERITEFGFGSVNQNGEDLMRVFRLNAANAGTISEVVLNDYVWLIRNFIDRRATAIVEHALHASRFAQPSATLDHIPFDRYLYEYYCSSEVAAHGGLRTNGCTSIARRMPQDLSMLSFGNAAGANVIIKIKGVTKPTDVKEMFSLWNLLGVLSPAAVVSARPPVAGDFRAWYTQNYIQNHHSAPIVAGETLFLNPMKDLDLYYACTSKCEVTLKLELGAADTDLRTGVLRMRREDYNNNEKILQQLLELVERRK